MRSRSVVASVLALLVLTPSSRADEIQTIDGRVEERVVSIARDAKGTWLTTEKRGGVALERVREIRFDDASPVEAGEAAVLLTNGDLVRGEIGKGDQNGFELDSAALGKIRFDQLEQDAVAAVFLGLSPERERKLEQKHLASRPGTDLVLLKGDATPVKCSVERLSREGVLLSLAGNDKIKLDRKLAQVDAIFFQKLATKGLDPLKGRLLVRARLTDGSLVTGSVLSLTATKLELEHGLGRTLTVERENLASLLVVNGKCVYLSDLAPSLAEESFPEGFERDSVLYAWKRDREVLGGGPLTLKSHVYEKGLGVHTRSRLVYDLLGGAYRKLHLTVGVDDRAVRDAGRGGKAVFRVLLNGTNAPEIGAGIAKQAGEKPTELVIDVQGKTKLELVADYGDSLHVLGSADWADAYFVK